MIVNGGKHKRRHRHLRELLAQNRQKVQHTQHRGHRSPAINTQCMASAGAGIAYILADRGQDRSKKPGEAHGRQRPGIHIKRSADGNHAVYGLVSSYVEAERTTERMSDQKHDIAALFELM